jgi:hypothetical protein
MTPLKFPILAMVVASACLLWGCKTAPKSESSTASSTPAPATAKAPEAKSAKSGDAKEGEIVGTPAKNSKFTKLQMGMGMKQVTDLIGQPTDQGAYVTGKAFIPFYFGSDRYRHELVYKGQGRLVFAGGSVGNPSAGRLIRIVHNEKEPGNR